MKGKEAIALASSKSKFVRLTNSEQRLEKKIRVSYSLMNLTLLVRSSMWYIMYVNTSCTVSSNKHRCLKIKHCNDKLYI